MSSATRLLGLSIALASALVSHSFAKESSPAVGPLSLNASAFTALTYVGYDTISRDGEPEWKLRPISAAGSFTARASLRLTQVAEVVAEVRGRTSAGFPDHTNVRTRETGWYAWPLLRAAAYDDSEEEVLGLGDVHVVLQTPGERYRVTAGRFVLPIGPTETWSDNASTAGRRLAVNPLIVDALTGSSVDLPRELGVRFDVAHDRSVVTLAVARGIGSAVRGDDYYGGEDPDVYRESMTLVGRAHISPSGSHMTGLWLTTFYTAETEPRTPRGYGGDIDDRFRAHGALLDLRTIRANGVELSGGISGFMFDDNESGTEDGAMALNVAVTVPLKPFFLSGAMSAWLPEDAGADDTGVSRYMPIVGYSLYRQFRGQRPGLNSDQRVYRFQIAADLPFAAGVELHAECVADRFSEGLSVSHGVGEPKHRDTTTVGALVGLRAAI